MNIEHATNGSKLEIIKQVPGTIYATVITAGQSGLSVGQTIEIMPAQMGIEYYPTC